MSSLDPKSGKGITTSLLYLGLLGLGTSAGAATVTARDVSCTPADHTVVRKIQLRQHSDSDLHCDVFYAKPDEGGVASVLWSSARDSGFCEERFERFVDKHRNVFGWSCSESAPTSSGAPAIATRDDAPGTDASDAVPDGAEAGFAGGAAAGGTGEASSSIDDDAAKAAQVALASPQESEDKAPWIDVPELAANLPGTEDTNRLSAAIAPQSDLRPVPTTPSEDRPATNASLARELFPIEDHVSDRVMEIALALESRKIGYNTEELSDCSGIFHRVLDALQGHFPRIELPEPRTHRSTRRLARWYHERGLLRLVSSAEDEDHAIRPGVVLFYGQNNKRYESASAEYLFDRATGIAHMGVVVDVERDPEGQVIGYGLFHGRRTGTEAKITRYHRRSPSKPSHPPYGNGAEQWVAYSPVLPPAVPSNVTGDLIAENDE